MKIIRWIGIIGTIIVIIVIAILKIMHYPSVFAVPFLLPFLVIILIDISGKRKRT